jgi:hypothetical protein
MPGIRRPFGPEVGGGLRTIPFYFEVQVGEVQVDGSLTALGGL